MTSESDLNFTASARASRECSWSNPTKVKYCLIGNSKRLVKLATQPAESIRCFLTIEPKTTSWEWTWLANFSRWVTPGHEGTPIISQAVSTPQALENYCLMKRTTRKHNRLRCSIRNGRRPERIRSIYNREAGIESSMKRREDDREKSAPSGSVGKQAYPSVRRDLRRTDGVFPLAYLSVALSTLSPARSTDLSTFSPARSIGPSRSQAARPPSNSIPATTGIANFLKLTMRCPPL